MLQWTLGYMFFELWFSQGIYPVVKLLGYMIVLVLVLFCFFFFKRISLLFSIVAVSIYIPTESAEGFPFLHILSNICRIFDDVHSAWCEVIPHCSLDLHFSNNEQCWACFHVFIGHRELDSYVSDAGTGWAGDVQRAREQSSWVAWSYSKPGRESLPEFYHSKNSDLRLPASRTVRN